MSERNGNNEEYEYFEFNVEDLTTRSQDNKLLEDESSSVSSPVSCVSPLSPPILRKTRLLVRKIHLMSYIYSTKHFFRQIKKTQELIATALSILPSHILRIFDPVMVSEETTLKNSVSMLATWWKNNIGLRMVPRKYSDFVFKSNMAVFKFDDLKLAIIYKSAYEDDLVKLFAIVCIGLGIRIRILQSLNLISASSAQKSSTRDDFKYVPTNWIEIYLVKEQRWIPIDCIQGTIDDKFRLEDKATPHSFVIATDYDGYIYDLTRKYALDFENRSFRLRKDEDAWLRIFIPTVNSSLNIKVLSRLPDLESVDNFTISAQKLDGLEIPKTLSAIKNHPILMLGSQLKKYEVFYPGTQPFGYFRDQPIYLKDQVHKVRSKDSWLNNFARIIKVFEFPLISFPVFAHFSFLY